MASSFTKDQAKNNPGIYSRRGKQLHQGRGILKMKVFSMRGTIDKAQVAYASRKVIRCCPNFIKHHPQQM